LIDDHYGRLDDDRQVTLIESENLATIASHLGKGEVLPQQTRRNIVTVASISWHSRTGSFGLGRRSSSPRGNAIHARAWRRRWASADITPRAAWSHHCTGDSRWIDSYRTYRRYRRACAVSNRRLSQGSLHRTERVRREIPRYWEAARTYHSCVRVTSCSQSAFGLLYLQCELSKGSGLLVTTDFRGNGIT